MDRIKRFVHLYQDITPLTMGELWALPVMLRLGIVECLAQSRRPHHRSAARKLTPRHDPAPRDDGR